MLIVLIWWRIKPTEDAAQQLKSWWRDHAQPRDASGLFGEFLSAPVPADTLPFASQDLQPASGEFTVFVNVGFWCDTETFHREIGAFFNDDLPLLEFEYTRRQRTLLRPLELRYGSWSPTP